jgi:hypothetical protein
MGQLVAYSTDNRFDLARLRLELYTRTLITQRY